MAVFNFHNKNMLKAIIVIIVLIVIVVFSISRCSHSSKDNYQPEYKDGKGFIGKADSLFSELLVFEVIIPKTERNKLNAVEQLNRRYPSLKFTLPDEVEVGECIVSDIRLVGINEKYLDSIKNKYLKTWYYSSELPKIIKYQQNNKFKKFFDLKITTIDGIAKVEHIKMIPSLYKIKFNSKPWIGTINGQSYGKIDTVNSLFIVYGSSILPVRRQAVLLEQEVQSDYEITLIDNHMKHNNKDIDLYEYYWEHYEKQKPMDHLKRILIKIKVDDNKYKSFVLQVVKDSIRRVDNIVIDLPSNLDIYCNTKKMSATTNPGQGEGSRKFYSFRFVENVVRLIVSDQGKDNKKAEFYLYRQNPMNMLSYSIETNKGKLRKQVDTLYTDNFTRQIIDIFNQKMDEKSPNKINLSLDPYLAKTLENELGKYVHEILLKDKTLHTSENIEMSISLINSATGEILAAPSYSTQKVNTALMLERKNPNTQRRFVGSCFKPLMTLATVLMYEPLLNMKLKTEMWQKQQCNEKMIKDKNNKEKKIYYDVTIMGHRVQGLSKDLCDQFKTNLDMTNFISKSNDIYPVILAMYAFTNPNGKDIPVNYPSIYPNFQASLLKPDNENKNTFVNPDYNIHNQRFARILDALYSVNSSDVKQNSQDMKNTPDIYVWRLYKQNGFNETDSISFPDISPEYTNMYYGSWYNETYRGKVISWVLGQGDNSWSPLKLSEAWARMTTKYPVQLSFIKNPQPKYQSLLPQEIQSKDNNVNALRWTTEKSVNDVWNTFLDIFKNAQKLGELLPPTLSRAQSINQNYIVLGKTGTPNEFHLSDDDPMSRPNNKEIKYDLGLYTLTLMTVNQYNRIKANRDNYVAQNSGITAVIRIVHTYKTEYGSCLGSEKADKIQSKHARNFISNSNSVLERILFYTDKLFR